MTIEFQTPDSAPKRGNFFTKAIALTFLKLLRWQLLGEFSTAPKFVAIAAPHRTSGDFFLGMMVLYSMGIKFSWMAKHQLFRWPIGGIMRWLGGIAINRAAAHGVVEQMAAEFAANEKLIVALTPQGTRKAGFTPVAEWKQGFYHIAKRANVPIMPIHLDYPAREIYFGKAIMLSDDKEADFAKIAQFYAERIAHLERTRKG